jgi:hypothetical protein
VQNQTSLLTRKEAQRLNTLLADTLPDMSYSELEGLLAHADESHTCPANCRQCALARELGWSHS